MDAKAREELVEMVRELVAEAAGCADENCQNCIRTARAAMAVIEPVVREAIAKMLDVEDMPIAAQLVREDEPASAIRGGSNGG